MRREATNRASRRQPRRANQARHRGNRVRRGRVVQNRHRLVREAVGEDAEDARRVPVKRRVAFRRAARVRQRLGEPREERDGGGGRRRITEPLIIRGIGEIGRVRRAPRDVERGHDRIVANEREVARRAPRARARRARREPIAHRRAVAKNAGLYALVRRRRRHVRVYAPPLPVRLGDAFDRFGERLRASAVRSAHGHGRRRPLCAADANGFGEHARGHRAARPRGVHLEEQNAHDEDVDEDRNEDVVRERFPVAARDERALAEHLADVGGEFVHPGGSRRAKDPPRTRESRRGDSPPTRPRGGGAPRGRVLVRARV